ncbi:hypothetical protein ACH427_04310 [Streptomyces sp. NPDC020379]|uniref:hypothetical protein n=1 Tax=Streptomyces sp. NPDC020379 TaxID=3365071 RepID=UPI00379019EF
MSVDREDIAREIFDYRRRYPAEESLLEQVIPQLCAHARAGAPCVPECPVVEVGGLLVDEQDRVLTTPHSRRGPFPQQRLAEDDESLRAAALLAVVAVSNTSDVWIVAGQTLPIVVEVSPQIPGAGYSGSRLTFRYVFQTFTSSDVLDSKAAQARASWLPLEHLKRGPLGRRLVSALRAAEGAQQEF